MNDAPTPPEADDVAEADQSDESLEEQPEVEGFMEPPRMSSFGSIMPPIKPTQPPTGPAGPGSGPAGDTIGGGSGGSTNPNGVNFPPRPA
jgi:hypothetical protein